MAEEEEVLHRKEVECGGCKSRHFATFMNIQVEEEEEVSNGGAFAAFSQKHSEICPWKVNGWFSAIISSIAVNRKWADVTTE